jgi:hypothetical protein
LETYDLDVDGTFNNTFSFKETGARTYNIGTFTVIIMIIIADKNSSVGTETHYSLDGLGIEFR